MIEIRENQNVIDLKTINIFGEMPEEKITMRKIDSYCGTLKERIPIYVRETKAFSKKRQLKTDWIFFNCIGILLKKRKKKLQQ